MSVKGWEYMQATASLRSPQKLSFFEERFDRLYRGVDLDTIGAHGWELVSVVMVSYEGKKMRYEYFFKRPRKEELVTLYEKDN